jgi:hypothetical protein
MSFLRSLKLFFSRSESPGNSEKAGSSEGATSTSRRDFTADYNAAVQVIKPEIDVRFPDNYQANFKRNRSTVTDYSGDRAEAIDTSSAAIAAALRKGATVRQAAEAGATSIGI